MKKWLLLCLLAWWPQVSRAGDVFSELCARAGIPRELAVAIARQESSLNHLAINIQGHSLRPRSVGQALDYIRRAEAGKKSYDVGLMQINNQWFGKLGITAEELLDPQKECGNRRPHSGRRNPASRVQLAGRGEISLAGQGTWAALRMARLAAFEREAWDGPNCRTPKSGAGASRST